MHSGGRLRSLTLLMHSWPLLLHPCATLKHVLHFKGCHNQWLAAVSSADKKFIIIYGIFLKFSSPVLWSCMCHCLTTKLVFWFQNEIRNKERDKSIIIIIIIIIIIHLFHDQTMFITSKKTIVVAILNINPATGSILKKTKIVFSF